ncbi:G5 domain-containing protein [Amnibacterium flavum]|nr:G5 domain-containing protein [Amnibacterium flavum]
MAEPGWYDDPRDARAIRWWDGERWSLHTAPKPPRAAPPTAASAAVASPSPAPRAENPTPASPQHDIYARQTVAVATPAAGSPGLRRASGLSRRNLILLVALAVLVLIVGVTGLANAASSLGGQPRGIAAVPLETAKPTPSPTPTGPKITYQTATETAVVPFNRLSQDDPSRDSGTTAIVVPGVDGTLTRTFRVTLEDGVEVKRELTGESVTLAPIDEVTAVGTYVAPPPPPAPVAAAPEPQGGGCDPNYADGCVPVSSDVDCAGGSGDGPAYFSGTARVVGSDIYDLDRDGNGIACQS